MEALPPDLAVRVTPTYLHLEWSSGRGFSEAEMELRTAFPGVPVSPVHLRGAYLAPREPEDRNGPDRGTQPGARFHRATAHHRTARLTPRTESQREAQEAAWPRGAG